MPSIRLSSYKKVISSKLWMSLKEGLKKATKFSIPHFSIYSVHNKNKESLKYLKEMIHIFAHSFLIVPNVTNVTTVAKTSSNRLVHKDNTRCLDMKFHSLLSIKFSSRNYKAYAQHTLSHPCSFHVRVRLSVIWKGPFS